MSEYVTIDVEYGDDPLVADVFINQALTPAEEEVYAGLAEGEVGSPLAQMLFGAVDGLDALTISADCLTITRQPSHSWEALIDDLRDALRDWYL